MKPKVHFRACYTSIRIRGPTSRSKLAQDHEKRHFYKPEEDTRIQGPNDVPNQQNFRGTQRSNTKAHLSVVQRKEGPRGAHSGSVDPLGRPNHYWAQ